MKKRKGRTGECESKKDRHNIVGDKVFRKKDLKVAGDYTGGHQHGGNNDK